MYMWLFMRAQTPMTAVTHPHYHDTLASLYGTVPVTTFVSQVITHTPVQCTATTAVLEQTVVSGVRFRCEQQCYKHKQQT